MSNPKADPEILVIVKTLIEHSSVLVDETQGLLDHLNAIMPQTAKAELEGEDTRSFNTPLGQELATADEKIRKAIGLVRKMNEEVQI